MGCEYCKESDPKSYQKCQSKLKAIALRKPTSAIHFIAPCGEQFSFGAKFTPKKKKHTKKKKG